MDPTDSELYRIRNEIENVGRRKFLNLAPACLRAAVGVDLRDCERQKTASPTSPTMKLAAIDIGSNSFHMIIARISSDGQLEVIDRTKEMVRLGERTLVDGYIAEAAQERGLDALRRFRRLADSHGVDDIIAVATSATREARNGRDFMARVETECGIRGRVISGEEEGRLIYLGTREVYDFGARKALIIDIGGGSVEIVLGERRRALIVRSFRLGVRRLHEAFLPSDPTTPAEMDALRDHVRTTVDRLAEQVRSVGFDTILATSGTARVLTQIASAALGTSTERLTQDELAQTVALLAGMSHAEREHVSGLDDKRRDAIVEGALLLHTLIERFGGEGYEVCDAALREGMIVDYLERNRLGLQIAAGESDPRRRSVALLSRRLSDSDQHPAQVAALALRLFDDLQPMHLGTREERDFVEFAGQLHDIGRVVAHSGFHRHTQYIIHHADLHGFSAEERGFLAALARYHRRSMPKTRHEGFVALAPARQARVRVLSVLLRLANSLDRGYRGNVQALSARFEDDRVELHFRTDSDPSLEVASLLRHVDVVRHAWDRALTLIPDSADAVPLPIPSR